MGLTVGYIKDVGWAEGHAIGFIAKKSVSAFAQIYSCLWLSYVGSSHAAGVMKALCWHQTVLLHGVCCLDDLELMKVSRRENMKLERATSFDSCNLKENVRTMVGQLLM